MTIPSAINISALGGNQIKVGGGCVTSVVVTTAASTDATMTLYDGIGPSGNPIAILGLSSVGPAALPNYAFGTGLFAFVTGATAGTVRVVYQ
jgi:hypothetical protein